MSETCPDSAPRLLLRFIDRNFTYNKDLPREPGDIYWFDTHIPRPDRRLCWETCDGIHLRVVLPAKFPGFPHYIDTDLTQRVGNCSLPDDQKHRCRTVRGELPKITLEAGCAVGPSIGYPWPPPFLYHGFIRDGELIRA